MLADRPLFAPRPAARVEAAQVDGRNPVAQIRPQGREAGRGLASEREQLAVRLTGVVLVQEPGLRSSGDARRQGCHSPGGRRQRSGPHRGSAPGLPARGARRTRRRRKRAGRSRPGRGWQSAAFRILVRPNRCAQNLVSLGAGPGAGQRRSSELALHRFSHASMRTDTLIRSPAQASTQAFVSLLVAALVAVLLAVMVWPI